MEDSKNNKENSVFELIWNNRPLGHILAIYKLSESFHNIGIIFIQKRELCIKFGWNCVFGSEEEHFKKMSIENVLAFF